MNKKVIYSLALVFVLIGAFSLAFSIPRIEASGTITIRRDGSVEGTNKIISSDNVTYTFTSNINDSIVVERNDIVVDGDGYLLQGTGIGTGIDLSERKT